MFEEMRANEILISEQAIVQRNINQDYSKIDDEIVMLNLKNAEYYSLNEVASRIWENMEKPISVSNLIQNLMNEFDVDLNTCRNDTFACLNEFKEKSLIIISDDK